VVAEKLFVVVMFVHWAGFYADSGVCQDVEKDWGNRTRLAL